MEDGTLSKPLSYNIGSASINLSWSSSLHLYLFFSKSVQRVLRKTLVSPILALSVLRVTTLHVVHVTRRDMASQSNDDSETAPPSSTPTLTPTANSSTHNNPTLISSPNQPTNQPKPIPLASPNPSGNTSKKPYMRY